MAHAETEPERGADPGPGPRDVRGAFVAFLGLLAALVAPATALYLLVGGVRDGDVGAAEQWLDTKWFPGEGRYGVLPLVVGTLSTSLGALLLAVPLGLLVAIRVRFFSGRRTARTAEMALGAMAGMPSVVFGLFGTFWLVPWLGASLLSAALVLAMMIVPSFALFALAALRQVPDGLMRDGLALGLDRGTVIRDLALPTARPGLFGAATLALARALGEALAVEMVAGNVPNLPTSLLDPVRTMTATLVQEFEYARGEHLAALHLVALGVVAVASLLVTIAFRLGHGRIHATPEAA